MTSIRKTSSGRLTTKKTKKIEEGSNEHITILEKDSESAFKRLADKNIMLNAETKKIRKDLKEHQSRVDVLNDTMKVQRTMFEQANVSMCQKEQDKLLQESFTPLNKLLNIELKKVEELTIIIMSMEEQQLFYNEVMLNLEKQEHEMNKKIHETKMNISRLKKMA